MNKIVEVTKLQILNNPTMEAIKTAFQIKEGRPGAGAVPRQAGPDDHERRRLQRHRPVDGVQSGAQGAAVAAGRGQSGAGRSGLQGGRLNLSAAPEIPLGIQLSGTVTNPSVKVDVGSLTSSVTQGAQQAVKQAVTQKVDSAAMRLVQQAEAQAAAIRQQAESLAAKVKLPAISRPTR